MNDKCNHMWTKTTDGYFCCLCGGTSKNIPNALLKQTTLGERGKEPCPKCQAAGKCDDACPDCTGTNQEDSHGPCC